MMNMNSEEFDRRMAFIVEQQAQFAADIQRLEESQTRTDQVVARTAEVVGQMGEVVTRLAHVTHVGFTDVNAKINALVDAQIRAEEKQARTEENIARTQENILRTDEILRNLIATVDRHLKEGRDRN